MAKWNKIVSDHNRRAYKWPSGWSTREEIAEELECSPERVQEILAPAIRAGEVERAQHPIWDEATRRKIMVTGYRPACSKNIDSQELQPSNPSKQTKDRWPFSEGARVTRMGSPTVGTVKGRRIYWDSGVVTVPNSNSTIRKLRLASK